MVHKLFRTRNRIRIPVTIIVVFFILLWLGNATLLDASGYGHRSSATTVTPQRFVLTIRHERISLKATNAPLEDVLDELGDRLHTEVIAEVAPGETITDEFSELTLEQALARLSKRHVLFMDHSKTPPQLRKIFIYTSRAQTRAPEYLSHTL